MWLISFDTLPIALPVTFALTLFTFAITLALCADVVAEHGAEDKILFGRKLVERTCNDESDSIQTLASSEIHIQVLLSGGL